MFNFKNKVALVTGAASGIGKEVALTYAKFGAKVVISDILDDRADHVLKEIQKIDGQATFCHCDVSNEHDVEKLIETTLSTFSGLHLACNDAGIEGKSSTLTDIDSENWNQVLEINLKGMWLSLKYQIPAMIQSGGGSIVNLSSIAGLVGFEGSAPYVASKHGVIGLTKTAALEFAEKNIRVNAICPGPIHTDMLQRFIDKTPGFEASITAQVPMKRIGNVKEVASAIAFLSSADASYITGQALPIDGGWIAK